VPPPDAAIDAPPDAPPVDTDGDSLFDFEDNCPALANASQHDEDDDMLGDVCDPCPHLAGSATDGDGDGVGDACDPDPAVAKHSIKFFDGFETTKTEWNYSSAYTLQADQLRFNGNGGGTAKIAVPVAENRIIVGGSNMQIGASLPRSFSVEFGITDSGMDYFYGNFYENGTGTSISVTRADSGSYVSVAGPVGPGNVAFPTGAFMMQVDLSVSTQQLAILATLGGVAYPLQSGAAGTPALVADNEITLYARNVPFRFDYIVVIETAP